MITKLPETLHYIYDSNWFPENFVTITEVQSELIQRVKIAHNNIEIIIHNAENQSFTFTNIPDNTNRSLEASSIENMDAIVRSRPMETNFNESTGTDFNSRLLDD